jgi:hypothetical protein
MTMPIFALADGPCISLLATGTPNSPQRVPGLFESISIRRHIELIDGVTLNFEDYNDGKSLESRVVAQKGSEVLWHGHLEIAVKDDELVLDVILIDGDSVPGFIKPTEHVYLNEKGIPLSSFLLLRGMKLLGLEDISKFRIEKIRHAETVIDIAKAMKEKFQNSGQYIVAADDIVEIFKRRALHRLAETALIQAGFKIQDIQLSPGEDQGPVDGATKVKTMFAPGGADIKGVLSLRQAGESTMGQFKSEAVDKKKLEKKVKELMIQYPDLKDLIIDFSMVYDLSSI